ncbi:MAG: Xaa-Pro dipeptidyl-peptidase [Planctomycetota bacterium]
MIRPSILVPVVVSFLPALSAQDASKAAPVFKDGEAQVVPAFSEPGDWIQEELWVESSFDSDGDGKPDRMHVDVTRQKQTETEGLKVAVIYETSPYFSGTGSTRPEFFWDPHQQLGSKPKPRGEMPPIPFAKQHNPISGDLVRTWVPRGFAVVHSESPGTGLSQGCPTIGGQNEALAPKAVIDWLCGRAKGFTTIDGTQEIKATWCSGKVGMTGTSYNGTLPIAAATTGVEGLEAIIPVSPNTSYYEYYRSNGLVKHPGGYMGEDVDVLYDFINSGDPEMRAFCNQHVKEEVLHANQDRVTGDFSDFWAGRDYSLQMAKWHAATLMAHGFNDWNVMPDHTVRIYAALKKMGIPCMAFFHQGGHGGDPPLPLMNKWFSRYLYGQQNGVEGGPHAWIVRESDRRTQPTAYADYPNPEAAAVTLFPQKGGSAVGGLTESREPSQGRETLVDDASITGAALAKAEQSEHRLLYATAELKEPLHLSGTARLHIRLAADAPAANLSVWLVALPWTGGRNPNDDIITRGWADPQNHASLRKGEPLKPGEFVELAFDLKPDDQIVPAGQRIGLMVFSSDHDFTLWPDPGTRLTVDLDATSLDLPVVGGAKALHAALGGK